MNWHASMCIVLRAATFLAALPYYLLDCTPVAHVITDPVILEPVTPVPMDLSL